MASYAPPKIPGIGIWRVGHGVPAVGLGQDGDAYVDLDSGLEYFRAGGWGQIIQPTLPAPKITGQLTDAQIAGLAAGKITGVMALSQLPTIPLSKISGVPTITTSPWAGGPPVGAIDGDIWIATAVNGATNVTWAFVRLAGVYPTFPWQFIGGPPRVAPSGSSWTQNTINTWQEYGAGTITDMRVTPGRAGIYSLDWTINGSAPGAGASTVFGLSGVIGTSPSGFYRQASLPAGYWGVLGGSDTFSITSGQTFTLLVQTNGTGANFFYPVVQVLPYQIA